MPDRLSGGHQRPRLHPDDPGEPLRALYELNRIANVLPGTLGRICSRPCEDACRHGWPGNGAPVNICHLKRAAADHKPGGHRITENLFTLGQAHRGRRRRLAGIAAAHDLSMLGHDVTMFEQEKIPGSMLYYGIPEFRLPRDVLAVEVRNALRLGVELRAGVAVGKGEGEVRLSSLLEEYDAVLLATGCMAAIRLPLRGVDDFEPDPVRRLPNAEYGLDFLMELDRGEPRPWASGSPWSAPASPPSTARACRSASGPRTSPSTCAPPRSTSRHQGGDPRGQARGD